MLSQPTAAEAAFDSPNEIHELTFAISTNPTLCFAKLYAFLLVIKWRSSLKQTIRIEVVVLISVACNRNKNADDVWRPGTASEHGLQSQ